MLGAPIEALRTPCQQSYFSGPIMSSSSLPPPPQPYMTGLSAQDLTISPASVVSHLDAPASTRVVRAFFIAGTLSVVVPVSVDLGSGSPSCASDGIAKTSSTSPVPASSTLSRSCAIMISAGSLPLSINDASALDVATLSRQLAVAGRQHESARRELASVPSELHKVKGGKNELRSTFGFFHFHATSRVCFCWQQCPGLTL